MESFEPLPNIPKLGLGTWKMDDEKVYEVVLKAIKIGYRYIDCAWEYENEKGVGKAIKEAIDNGIVKREDLFIVTKLWNTYHRPELVEVNIKDSLKRLNLTYIDLYLIHWPLAFKPGNDPYPRVNGHIQYDKVPLHETWKAMEELTKNTENLKFLAKYIGVSNFPSILLHDLMMSATIKPIANQIESHLYLQQTSLVKWCEKNNIIVMAYSPLGGSYDYGSTVNDKKFEHPLKNATVLKLANEKNCSSSDIIYAWHRQRSDKYVIVSKSEKEERLKQALNVVEGNKIVLTDEEMELLSKEDKNLRLNDAAKVFWEIPSFE
jgi:diketogulonate reductase-like aldo/keto reductase